MPSRTALVALSLFASTLRAHTPAQIELFEKSARPLFASKCQGCHNPKLKSGGLDLTGLPPTEKELADFLADKSPKAFEKVVDRLLASPRYGERWGRH